MANTKNFKSVNSNAGKEMAMKKEMPAQSVNSMELFFEQYGDIRIDVPMTSLLESDMEFLTLKLRYISVEYVVTDKIKGLKFRFEAKNLINEEHYGEVVQFIKLPEDVRKHLPYMLNGLIDQLGANSLEELYTKGSSKTAVVLLTHEVSEKGKEYTKVDSTRQARADALMARDNALASK
mgnify:CR=1 FL=1|jgi:hypothetical protein